MKLRLPMRTPAVVGTLRSVTRIPAFDSTAVRFASSEWGVSKMRRASSDTNLTARSGPRRTQATPEATSRLTTLVIAGDADSTGKLMTGAFGNGSGAMAGAVAALARGCDDAAACGAVLRASEACGAVASEPAPSEVDGATGCCSS